MNYWLLIIPLLLIVYFHSRFGLLMLYRNWRDARQRELVEDALKHLLDREQGGRHASPESLAGTLGLSRVKNDFLITRMESQGRIQTHGSELHLTPNGETLGITYVRAHRLWEALSRGRSAHADNTNP